MPMIIELVVAMLACARIGAVHSIVVREHFKIPSLQLLPLFLFFLCISHFKSLPYYPNYPLCDDDQLSSNLLMYF